MYCSDDELLIQGFNLAVRIRIGCEPALNWRDLEEALSEHDSGCLTGWIWVGSHSGSQIPQGGLHFFRTKSGFGPCPTFNTGFVYGMKRYSPRSFGEQVAHANVPLVVLQSGQLPADDK